MNKLIGVVACRMKLDQHADPQTGGYSVEGIYYETPELNVFNRTPGYSRKKFRIRRYSEGATLFLERKAKRKGIVTKKRIQLEANRLSEVLQWSTAMDSAAASTDRTELDWFARRIDKQKLRPTLCIAYDRVAFLQMEHHGPIRLTIDRGLGCCKLDQSDFPRKSGYQRILEGQCVVELKYREALPTTFHELIEEFQLRVQPVSKFRHGMLVTGLASPQDRSTAEGTDVC